MIGPSLMPLWKASLKWKGGPCTAIKETIPAMWSKKSSRFSPDPAYEAQQETIRRTEEYIRRYKAGIKSKMARGRQSQLDRMERIDAPVKEESFTLRLPHAAESAEKVIMLEHLSVGYEGNAF